MNHDDPLMEMVSRYAMGIASADDVRTLEGALLADSQFRERFLRYMNVDTALGALRITPGTGLTLARGSGRTRLRAAWIVSSFMGVAAAIAVCVWIWRQRPASTLISNPPNVVVNDVVAPAATLIAENDANWSDPNVQLALNGGEMPQAFLNLAAGRVEFLLADGATAVIQGPAIFRFAEKKRILVTEGRVVCNCPTPQSRVTVATPQIEVVDLGTVFSVEARPDQSTRVAVLSGEVEIKGNQPQRLHKGDTAEVRTGQVLRLEPLSPAESERLARTIQAESKINPDTANLLLDPGFEMGLDSKLWHGTDECLEASHAGRYGNAVRVYARGHRFWPLVRQDVKTGDISGKLAAASIWASVPATDRLRGKQHAVLKLAFVDSGGREFACASRRFLNAQSVGDRFEQAAVAAEAPVGTFGVQVQLILSADGQKSGSIIFDDASLTISGDSSSIPISKP